MQISRLQKGTGNQGMMVAGLEWGWDEAGGKSHGLPLNTTSKSTHAPRSEGSGKTFQISPAGLLNGLPLPRSTFASWGFPLKSHMLSLLTKRKPHDWGGKMGNWKTTTWGNVSKYPSVLIHPIINNLSSPRQERESRRPPTVLYRPSPRSHLQCSCDRLLWCRLIPSMCD